METRRIMCVVENFPYESLQRFKIRQFYNNADINELLGKEYVMTVVCKSIFFRILMRYLFENLLIQVPVLVLYTDGKEMTRKWLRAGKLDHTTIRCLCLLITSISQEHIMILSLKHYKTLLLYNLNGSFPKAVIAGNIHGLTYKPDKK